MNRINQIASLRELRVACGLSQGKLGALFRPAISFSHVSHIEGGTKPFPIVQSVQINDVIERLSRVKESLEKHGIQAENKALRSGRRRVK